MPSTISLTSTPRLRRGDQRGTHLRAGLVIDIDVIEHAQRRLRPRDQVEQRGQPLGPLGDQPQRVAVDREAGFGGHRPSIAGVAGAGQAARFS